MPMYLCSRFYSLTFLILCTGPWQAPCRSASTDLPASQDLLVKIVPKWQMAFGEPFALEVKAETVSLIGPDGTKVLEFGKREAVQEIAISSDRSKMLLKTSWLTHGTTVDTAGKLSGTMTAYQYSRLILVERLKPGLWRANSCLPQNEAPMNAPYRYLHKISRISNSGKRALVQFLELVPNKTYTWRTIRLS